ncbi:MAG TPA: M20/M25/M40 family metallo-hydrolase, partial [Gemmatimonadaceae bacterium]|nr:M20/M25/M40 family metallo-hydrolase [Gemmatimonadaceae bacterium]
PFTSYGETVRYRSGGANAASRVGAVAALIRSVASYSLQSPHTGSMSYDTTLKRIPAAALSIEDAMMLHRMSDRGQRITLNLRMGARVLPDAKSRNVVAELRGSTKPDEVVVLGGHIDSWDVGTGAMDDGGGSVAAWEAVRLIKRLGLRPKRTLRVVLWTNEENGLRGATAYRDAHRGEIDKHVFAIESDNGAFNPSGVSIGGTDATVAMAADIASLLGPVSATAVSRGGPPADVSPLYALGVPTMEPDTDQSRYFWYHHSDGDTVDKLDPAEMARLVAVMAVMAYVVADMPGTLPRAEPAPPASRR